MKPLKGRWLRFGRIQIGAVNRDPEPFVVPYIDEGVVDSRILPVVPQILVVVDLDHAAVVQLLHGMIAELVLVPGGGVGGIHLLKFPQQIHQALHVFRRDGLPDHHVAARDPVLPVVFREHAQRQSLLDVAELGFGDISDAGVSRTVLAVGVAICSGFESIRHGECLLPGALILRALAPLHERGRSRLHSVPTSGGAGRQGLGAEAAAPGVDGNLAQTFGTLLGGGIGRRRLPCACAQSGR